MTASPIFPSRPVQWPGTRTAKLPFRTSSSTPSSSRSCSGTSGSTVAGPAPAPAAQPASGSGVRCSLGHGRVLLRNVRAVEASDLVALAAQLDEDRDLLADDLRVERLDQIVGAAGGVGPMDLLGVVAERGDEDDRDVPAALEHLHVRGDLEAVHPRHGDVDQRHRESLAQREPQGLLAGGGGHHAVVGAVEDGRERDEVLRPCRRPGGWWPARPDRVSPRPSARSPSAG